MHGITITYIDWRWDEKVAVIDFRINEYGLWDYDPGNTGWRFIGEDWQALVPKLGHKDHTPTPVWGPTFAKYVWDIAGIKGLTESSVFCVDVQLAMFTACPTKPKQIYEPSGAMSGKKTKTVPLPPFNPPIRVPIVPLPSGEPGDPPIVVIPGPTAPPDPGGGPGGPKKKKHPNAPIIPSPPTQTGVPPVGIPGAPVTPRPIDPKGPTKTPPAPIDPRDPKPKGKTTGPLTPDPYGRIRTGPADPEPPDPKGPTTKKVGPRTPDTTNKEPWDTKKIDDIVGPGRMPIKPVDGKDLPKGADTRAHRPDDISMSYKAEDLADPDYLDIVARSNYPAQVDANDLYMPKGNLSTPYGINEQFPGINTRGVLRDSIPILEPQGVADIYGDFTPQNRGTAGLDPLSNVSWQAMPISSGSNIKGTISVLPNTVPYGKPVSLAGVIYNGNATEYPVDIYVLAHLEKPYILAEEAITVEPSGVAYWRGLYTVSPVAPIRAITWSIIACDSSTKELLAVDSTTTHIQLPDARDPHTAIRQVGTEVKPSVYLDQTVTGLYPALSGDPSTVILTAKPTAAANILLEGSGPFSLLVSPIGGKLENAQISAKIVNTTGISAVTGLVPNYSGSTITTLETALTYKTVPVMVEQQYVGSSEITGVPSALNVYIEAAQTVPVELTYPDTYAELSGLVTYNGTDLSGRVSRGNAKIFIFDESASGEANSGAYIETYTNSIGEFTVSASFLSYYSIYPESMYGGPDLSTVLYRGEV